MINNDDKKNPNAVEDFKDGLKGNELGLFSDRSKENEDGLKKKAEVDEEEQRDEKKTAEEKEDDDNSDDEDNDTEAEYRNPLLS